MWERQRRTSCFQELNGAVDSVLGRILKIRPPLFELIREFDIPRHDVRGILLYRNSPRQVKPWPRPERCREPLGVVAAERIIVKGLSVPAL
jgi:hypothetical protein